MPIELVLMAVGGGVFLGFTAGWAGRNGAMEDTGAFWMRRVDRVRDAYEGELATLRETHERELAELRQGVPQ